jgi:membrane protein YdbS with pleckstrin-like domain
VYTTVGFTVLDAWFGDLAWWWALAAVAVVVAIVVVSRRLERAPADSAGG